MSLRIAVPPSLPPVSLPEAKAHLRIDHDDEDSLISGLVESATTLVQDATWLQLVTADWELKLDEFPAVIYAPRGPLQSAEIEYVDGAGVTQTLSPSDYTVDADSVPGRIMPAYGKCWPITRCEPNSVVVTLTSGYGGDPGEVPAPIRTAILMLTSHLYENRGACGGEMPEWINWLLNPYRMTYARGTVSA